MVRDSLQKLVLTLGRTEKQPDKCSGTRTPSETKRRGSSTAYSRQTPELLSELRVSPCPQRADYRTNRRPEAVKKTQFHKSQDTKRNEPSESRNYSGHTVQAPKRAAHQPAPTSVHHTAPAVPESQPKTWPDFQACSLGRKTKFQVQWRGFLRPYLWHVVAHQETTPRKCAMSRRSRKWKGRTRRGVRALHTVKTMICAGKKRLKNQKKAVQCLGLQKDQGGAGANKLERRQAEEEATGSYSTPVTDDQGKQSGK